MIDLLRRGLCHPRRQGRRLSGALLGAHIAGAAGAGRGRRRCRSKPMCAKTRSSCSAFAAMSSANGSACCRPCRASAPRWRSRCCSTLHAGRSRLRHRAARQGRGGAHARRRRRKWRNASSRELKDKAPAFADCRSGGGASVRRARGPARAAAGGGCDFGAGQSRLRPAAGGRRDRQRPHAASAMGAETAQLIRLRLEGTVDAGEYGACPS